MQRRRIRRDRRLRRQGRGIRWPQAVSAGAGAVGEAGASCCGFRRSRSVAVAARAAPTVGYATGRRPC